MSSGKIKKSNVFLMSLPIWVESFMQLLVGNVDQIMLSAISEDAVASIVNANQIANMCTFIMIFMGNACLVRFTHAVGKKDREMYDRAYFSSIVLLGGYAILVTLAVLFFADNAFRLMNVDANILDDAYHYLCIVAISTVFQGVYMVNVATLRSQRLLKDVMYISIVMNILNIIGNVVLINGIWIFPQLGVVGAGISTCLSKIIGCFLISAKVRRLNIVSFQAKYFKLFPTETMARLVYTAVPTSLQSLSYNIGQLVILSFLNSFGNDVIAVKGYCYIISNFAYLYSLALAQATQIIVGTHIGEGAFGKVKRIAFKNTGIGIAITIFIMSMLYIFSDYVFMLFSASDSAKALGKTVLGIDIFLEFGRCCNMMMNRMLVAMGDMKFMVSVSISSQWILAVCGGILVGSVFGLGLFGFWCAMAVEEIFRGGVLSLRFFKTKWTTEIVFKHHMSAA